MLLLVRGKPPVQRILVAGYGPDALTQVRICECRGGSSSAGSGVLVVRVVGGRGGAQLICLRLLQRQPRYCMVW